MVRLEWKHLFKNKILLLVVVAIIAIPTIYTTLFLGSMWDPYGKVDQMPVAVVNLDQPVTYEGKKLNVGEELVENLKDNDSLSFNFMNAEEAEAGIREGKYYMVITIPEDFSANASTLMDEYPKKMQLVYETNPGTNYIAMKMSESAMQKIKSSVAEEVTKTYAETVFEQLTDIGDGMQEAADGAGEVQDGVKKLSDGNEEITDNLKLLADSTLTFKEGSEELTVGLGDYTQGVAELQSGARTLSEGTGTLRAGAGELAAGVATLNSGALQLKNGTEAFVTGTKTLADGAVIYVEGTKILANGTKTYVDGTMVLANGVKTYVDGTAVLAGGTKTFADGTKTLAEGVKNYVGNSEKIKAGIDQLAGLEQLGQVSEGVAQLNAAVNQGSDTTPALKDATSSLAAGLQLMYMQVSGLKDTAAGEQLSELAGQLGTAVQGISDAAAGMNTAADTVGKAADGADTAAGVINQAVSALNSQIDANNAKIDDAENNINEQIDTANDKISAQGKEAQAAINTQLDNAIRAVEAARVDGGLSDEDANSIIGELQSAKVNDAVKGDISHADASNVKMQEISAGSAVQSLQQVSEGLNQAKEGLNGGANSLMNAAGSLQNGLSDIPADIDSDMLSKLAAGLKTAADGAAAINNGINGDNGLANALNQLETATSGFPQAAAGVKAVRAGMAQLTSYDAALTAGADQLLANIDTLKGGADQLLGNADTLKGGADQLLGNADTLKGGADQLLGNADALTSGAGQLLENADSVTAGANQVADGVQTLADAAGPLVDGVKALDEGAGQIYDGTNQLAANNSKLLSGSAALTDGAVQISDGAGKLADGSVELGDGLKELGDGSDELKTALADGADEINDIDATDEMMDMFAAPVDAEEVFITEVANNGHAMSAYMMSVALWVGCIAFCIMYPLMKYEGPIRSGFDWWLSKASVLFVMAIGMALVMLGMLHICNGFEPADWGQMILVACLASIAFMSIMYFFNVLLGKVGSFLMLIFMVVQLAGAAGTYPIELSGDFVATIHPWLPFSYTVDAFRAALAGAGDIHHAVMVLIAIIVVFTLLTINLFRIRTKENRHGRKNFYELLEERGLA